jgi:hypothetical protein
VTFWEVR